MTEALRALLVTYVWPPTGGIGVARVLKLAKYLPAFGVTPSVLTASNPSVPLTDESLARDIASDLEVLRARTVEPGYGFKHAAWQSDGARSPSAARRLLGRAAALGRQALVPDPQVLWQPGALWSLHRRLSSARADDVVFITAPPFSMFLSAPLVRLRRPAALVLDYRDEWTTVRSSYEMIGGVTAILGEPLERSLLRCADEITVATEAFRQALLDRFGFLDGSRVHAIPNGYDPDDFPPALLPPPTDRLVMTYAGTVYKLTSPAGLLRAIRKLHEREPALAALLRVRFIGRIVDTEAAAFDGMDRFGVERVGFVPKDRVWPELAQSHVVLVIQGDADGTERIYPGKLMELMYLRRPILMLSRPGAATDLLQRHNLGSHLPPADDAAIAGHIESLLRAFSEQRLPLTVAPTGIDQYHRRALAGEFAEVFRSAAARARARSHSANV